LVSFWKHWIFNVSVITELDGVISLFTLFPFSSGKCGDSKQIKMINEFSSTWKSDIFFPEKFQNLNQCPLKVSALSYSSPSIFVHESNGHLHFDGFEADMVREMAADFNMTAFFEPEDIVGTIYPNGSTTEGVLPSIYKQKTDVAIGMLSLQLERTEIFSETRSFLSVKTILVVPPGEFVTPFKKLVTPFTVLIWIILLNCEFM
jgi:hypothetical protein